MMALEEKFEIQLDEEGTHSHALGASTLDDVLFHPQALRRSPPCRRLLTSLPTRLPTPRKCGDLECASVTRHPLFTSRLFCGGF